MAKPITVLSVDDHSLFSAGLELLISAQEDMLFIGSISNPEDALLGITRLKPEIVLMDIRMPSLNGFELGQQILRDTQTSNSKLIFISTHQDTKTLSEAIELGAKGYVSKDASPKILLEAIRRVSNGHLCFHQTPQADDMNFSNSDSNGTRQFRMLSKRETEIFHLAASGLSIKEISEKLHLSNATVKTHVSKILSKLGFASRIQLIAFAHKNNLVL